MPQAPETALGEPLISLSEAARTVGVNKSTLSRQVKAGLIRSHEGGVRLSEVREDRKNHLDHSLWADRGKPAPSRGDATAAPLHATDTGNDATGDDEQSDSSNSPLGRAKTRKEGLIASIRELELEEKRGRLVDAATMRKAVFNLSRQDRDSWMNWPARVGPLIAAELGTDVVLLTVILEKYVRSHLAERAEPDLRVTGGGTGASGLARRSATRA